MENLKGSVNTHGQVFVKKQSSVLARSLLIGGLGFALVFGFAWALFAILMDSVGSGPQQDNVIIPLYIVSVIMLIASLIMSVVVSARIMKVKLATIISMIFLYGIANGISFGILFYAIQVTPDTNVHMVDFLVCFLITCGVFAITGFLGTLLSLRFTLSLGKFIMIATFSFMFIFLILIIVSLFTNILGGDKIQLVIYGIWGGLMILYVLYDFSMIKKSQSFTDLLDSDTQTKFVFMFGFTMLVNLIQLFWVAVRLMLLTKRR